MSEFDEKARDWDRDPSRIERANAVAEAMRRNLPISRQITAMEYGCGTGLLSFALYRDLGPMTLADSSDGMLEVLREKIAAAGAANMTPVKLDLGADPLPDDRFDLVYTLLTLHHIADVDTILRQFRNLLKPGGWLAICDLDEEDGSFHGAGFHGHKGFDRDRFARKLEEIGVAEVRVLTAYHLERDTEVGRRTFPLFLAIGRRL